MPQYLNGPDNPIGWCDFTWNPITGCTNGCRYCYARAMAERFKRSFAPALHTNRLDAPKKLGRRKKNDRPWRIFVGSNADMFCDAVPFAWLDRVFNALLLHKPMVSYEAPGLINTKRYEGGAAFQILTKKPKRMREYTEYFVNRYRDYVEKSGEGEEYYPFDFSDWFPHVHLGVSLTGADDEWRIHELLQIEAAVRFVSYEPMLEPLDLAEYIQHEPCRDCGGAGEHRQIITRDMAIDAGDKRYEGQEMWEQCGRCRGTGYENDHIPILDWVILGALTKNGRPVKDKQPAEDDVKQMINECFDAGVPIHVKDNVGCFKEIKEFPKIAILNEEKTDVQ